MGITDTQTLTRLRRLEADGVATRIASKAGVVRKSVDHLLARLENRIIEWVLIGRLRRAFRAANAEEAAQAVIADFRMRYASGRMESLPAFVPQAPGTGASPVTMSAPSGRQEATGHQRAVMLYTIGTGFIMPPSRRQKIMVQRLADATGCEIVLGQHRLAPEDKFPVPVGDLAAQYEAMIEDGADPDLLFVAADTAGASLTLGALQLVRERGLPMPAGLILFCPWCDLSMSGWSYITRSITAESPFRMETAAFCARLYLGDENPTHPLASAVFADLDGFPPLLIHTSQHDIHLDDALKVAERARAAGRPVMINYWDNPRHHMERLSKADAAESFSRVVAFMEAVRSGKIWFMRGKETNHG